MKTALVLCILFAAVIFGCASYSAPPAQPAPTPQQPSPSPAAEITPSQPIVGGTQELINYTSQTNSQIVAESGRPIGTFNATVSGQAVQITNCGGSGCFDRAFASCTAGARLSAAITSDLSYEYEIIGPSANGCSVKNWYSNNPNSVWKGKAMVCDYDNSVDLATSAEKVITNVATSCKGPLVDCFKSPSDCKAA